MPLIVGNDITLMQVCEAGEERSLAALSIGGMRKQRPHDAQIQHLGMPLFFIMNGVWLVPYTAVVTGQDIEVTHQFTGYSGWGLQYSPRKNFLKITGRTVGQLVHVRLVF